MEKTTFDSLLFRLEAPHPDLVREVVYSIPDKAILNPEVKFLDPAMGGGHFLRGIFDRAVELGVDPSSIKKRLYGIERSLVYTNYARWKMNLDGANLRTSNSYDLEVFGMKFDVIIGNPPYSLPKGQKAISDGTRNLSLRFIEQSVKILKEGGFMTMVTPLNFLKPTDSVKPTRSFSVLQGTSLVSVETGVERTWFPNIGTKIALWRAVKGSEPVDMVLNGEPWDISSVPFIVDLDREEIEVFKKIWSRMKTGKNPAKCRRVKEGEKLPEKGWSLTERVNRRMGKEFVIPWGPEPVREKYEQVHISLEPDVAARLFSQPHVRFFVKATNIEPTLYHNLFDGLDYGEQTFTDRESQIIEQFLVR